MSALDPQTRRRLIAAARLLESDKPGERHAATEAMFRLLPDGVTVADLLVGALSSVVPISRRPGDFRPRPSQKPQPFTLLRRWQQKALMLLSFPEMLNERELEFARDMRVRRDEPTQKQMAWLNNLAARVEARMAA